MDCILFLNSYDCVNTVIKAQRTLLAFVHAMCTIIAFMTNHIVIG